MRKSSYSGAVIAFAGLLLVPVSRGQEASSTPPSNDAIIHHMEELEEQVKELRTELAALKDQQDRDPGKSSARQSCSSAKQSGERRRNGSGCGSRWPFSLESSRTDNLERIRGCVLRTELQ